MKRSLLVAAVCLSSFAVAQGKPPAATHTHDEKPHVSQGMMDFSKMGPWTRKTDDRKVRKDVEEFLKKEEELSRKGDTEGMLARIDFPVFMLTDNATGTPESYSVSRDDYIKMMKPFWDNMPKDTHTVHAYTTAVLSDALVTVTDDFTMTMGKEKRSGRNTSVLVRNGGGWRWKVMAEAGWGDTESEPQAERAPAPQPKSPASTPASSGMPDKR